MTSDIERDLPAYRKNARQERIRARYDRAMSVLASPDLHSGGATHDFYDEPPVTLYVETGMGPFRCRGCDMLLRLVRTPTGLALFDSDGYHACPVGHDSRGCLTCGRRQRAISLGGDRSWFPPVPHAYEEGDL